MCVSENVLGEVFSGSERECVCSKKDEHTLGGDGDGDDDGGGVGGEGRVGDQNRGKSLGVKSDRVLLDGLPLTLPIILIISVLDRSTSPHHERWSRGLET